MPLTKAFSDFMASVIQCESLIVNAHKTDASGTPLFPAIDREQITVAAFLNMFIAWETFLEVSLAELMTGAPTVGGSFPAKYVSPPDLAAARAMVIGVMRYFDYANHKNMKKIVNMYFQNGYPYEPHISAAFADLDDLRTMRNAAAHISSTTQTAMEGLALKIFGQPKVGITLYQLLTTTDPRSRRGDTVFVTYKAKLVVTAELISQG